jgi:hypothetical protein
VLTLLVDDDGIDQMVRCKAELILYTWSSNAASLQRTPSFSEISPYMTIVTSVQDPAALSSGVLPLP